MSHDAYRPLLRDALLVLCLTMVVQTVSAQQGDGPLPRIGSMADSGEIRYFRLFPDIAAPDSAFVQATPVELTITVQDGEDRHRIVLSACEAEVFGRILLSFEQLARSDDALEQLRRLLPEPDLQRCFVSFMQKRVMAFSDFPALGGKSQRVLLRDGSEVEGVPMALTDNDLAMWRGGQPFDVRQIDALLEIIPLSHVDSVRGSFFTNSAGHGWLSGLIGAGATLWAIAELQREPRLGPGGTGTTVIPLPAAAVLAAGIGYCSGLLGASIAGDLRETIAFDGKHGDMAMEELH
ncbi:MAG: hypothetical protein KFF77_11330, partial [Bacteroidetes bacterium]|nr:hypothetical protein [Bacteroidota bacterium]